MSTIQDNQPSWPIQSTTLDNKYEKCLNITEEIYKRINITFQIKKLETASQSDVSNNSDQIDSNELSNETDLFAYEKSSSISSSVSDVANQGTCEKFINMNNNEESRFKKVPYATTQRPRKRFRKRVKKRQAKDNKSDTDCSSDEGLPLSRIVVECNSTKSSDELREDCVGAAVAVKNKELLQNEGGGDMDVDSKKTGEESNKDQHKSEADIKIHCSENNSAQEHEIKMPPAEGKLEDVTTEDKHIPLEGTDELADSNKIQECSIKQVDQCRSKCLICNATFRGSRGLKRHMTMSHINPEASSNTTVSQK